MATTQGIKLDEETQQRLRALGKLRDRSPHYLMKAAIVDYLQREEAYEQEKVEDMQRWEKYLQDGAHIDGSVMKSLLQDLSDGKTVTWPE